MKIITALTTAVLTCFLIATSSFAVDRPDDDQWHFKLAPLFLWGVSIDGTSQIGRQDLPLDLTFTDDLLENLSAVFTVHFEARRNALTFFAEYQYVDLEPSFTTPAGPSPELDFTVQLGELGAGYRVAQFGSSDLEVIGGARYSRQDMKVKLNPGPVLIDTSETWWDAFAGFRINSKITEKWTFIGRADIGAGSSDLVWNLMAMFDYRFKEWGSLFFGYRWLDYDYKSGSGLDFYAYDAMQQGPLAGISFYW